MIEWPAIVLVMGLGAGDCLHPPPSTLNLRCRATGSSHLAPARVVQYDWRMNATDPSPTVAAARRDAVLATDPPRDDWFGEDKFQHFFMSLALTHLAYGSARLAGLDRRPALVAAGGVSGAAGLWKEWYDLRRGSIFSVKDLVWDAAGIAAGLVAMRATL